MRRGFLFVVSICVLILGSNQAFAVEFTYQGKLQFQNQVLNDICDFQFRLYDAAVGGNLIGVQVDVLNITVTDGLFTVDIDFGPGVFDGANRWIEIDVLITAQGGGYTTLTPRQKVQAAPVAQFALNGNPGPIGPQGPTGPVGPIGPVGLEGLPGIDGAQGLPGVDGATGPTGPQGIPGIDGATGLTGPAGPIGPQGIQGLDGPAGPIGPQGIQGLDGPAGPIGPQGIPGIDGAQGLPGADGATGPMGPMGPQGLQGIDGPAGPTGPQGIQGLDGPAGPTGPQGLPGVDGATGPTGPQGAAGSDSLWQVSGTNMLFNTGNVGIGTTDPLYPLDVKTSLPTGMSVYSTATTGSSKGILGRADSDIGIGVMGEAGIFQGTAVGVYGQSWSISGSGVSGIARNTGGINYGVKGESKSEFGRGVYGVATATTSNTRVTYGGYFESAAVTGRGVLGHATATTGVSYGVYGQSDSTSGQAVFGEATATSGVTTGGRFTSNSTNGTGVFGDSTASTGSTVGVLGVSLSNSGFGVYGVASAASGITSGGYFKSASTSGRAVYGEATATTGGTYGGYFKSAATTGRGVLGYATSTTGNAYGVFGESDSSSGRGVYAVATSATGVALYANNSANAGQIIIAANGSDTEFRVDSSGNVFCDLAFNGGGADYAEWLQRLDPNETILPGQVVGVRNGKITKDTRNAQQIMVISTNPVLVGNNAQAEDDTREGYDTVAFIGQAPVQVVGVVNAGDFLIASGNNDGTAIAVARRDLTPAMIGSIIGSAWESSNVVGLKTINAAIGIDQTAVASAIVIRNAKEMAALSEQNAQLQDRLDRLEALVVQMATQRER